MLVGVISIKGNRFIASLRGLTVVKRERQYNSTACHMVRRDKLNSPSQSFRFCMRAGSHYSDFKLVERLGWLCSSLRSPEPRPLIRALERVRPKVLYIYCIGSEI